MDQDRKGLQKDSASQTPYDQILRAIGQALEPLEIQDFDLDISGGDYVVRGHSTSKAKKEEKGQRGFKNAIKDAWNKFEAKSLGQAMPDELSSPFLVLELHFGPDDVERLERQGRAARRAGSEATINPNRLSQILRALGAYVNRKSVRPLKVSKRKDWVSVEYETIQGRTDVEEFRTADLYDFWVHLFRQRKNPR